MSSTIDKMAEAARSRLVKANLDHKPRSLMYACPSCMFDSNDIGRFTATSNPRCCGKCAIDGRKELFADSTSKLILVSTWITEAAYHTL